MLDKVEETPNEKVRVGDTFRESSNIIDGKHSLKFSVMISCGVSRDTRVSSHRRTLSTLTWRIFFEASNWKMKPAETAVKKCWMPCAMPFGASTRRKIFIV